MHQQNHEVWYLTLYAIGVFFNQYYAHNLKIFLICQMKKLLFIFISFIDYLFIIYNEAFIIYHLLHNIDYMQNSSF